LGTNLYVSNLVDIHERRLERYLNDQLAPALYALASPGKPMDPDEVREMLAVLVAFAHAVLGVPLLETSMGAVRILREEPDMFDELAPVLRAKGLIP
jgi:hypothetical protein